MSYRADLLPSCYDEWIVPERERLRQQYLVALAQLVRLLEAQHDYAAAIRHAQSWLRYDPLAEDAYRALMRLLVLTNDRAGALRVYQTCVTTLQRELGVKPGPATQDSYRRLLHMEAPVPSARGARQACRRRAWPLSGASVSGSNCRRPGSTPRRGRAPPCAAER